MTLHEVALAIAIESPFKYFNFLVTFENGKKRRNIYPCELRRKEKPTPKTFYTCLRNIIPLKLFDMCRCEN